MEDGSALYIEVSRQIKRDIQLGIYQENTPLPKAMVRKLREGKITRAAVVQAVNSWLGFARWASAYNLAKKIFAPYRFIKTEGAIPYGAISRNRQARRLLQQRRNP